MLLSTILSLSILAAPHELSITKSVSTASGIAKFGGVEVSINRATFRGLEHGSSVVVPNFPLGEDKEVSLRLQQFDVFTPDAKVVIGHRNKDGVTFDKESAKPSVVLLRGTITGEPNSRVFLALGKHTSNGLIQSNGNTYVLVKDKTGGWTAVYNIDDINPEDMNWVDFKCDVADATSPMLAKNNNRTLNTGGTCQALQVAVDTDWEFTSELFGGNVSASGEYAAALFGAVSTIYDGDVGVEIRIPYLRLWDNPADPWDKDSTGEQLSQFREYWEGNMEVPRHLAHLISGRQLGGGVAWVGVVCTTYGYAFSANIKGSFPYPLDDNNPNNWDPIVVAHETGHNCGTWHTHDYSPPIDNCGNGDCAGAFGGTIMSYCHQCSGGLSNIVLSFHPLVQETIEDFLGGVSCSLDCGQVETGACCLETVCSVMTNEDCDVLGGFYQGVDTFCGVGSCGAFQPGACCAVDGTCTEIDGNACMGTGGIFLGIGSTCDDGLCDPDGLYACCIVDTCSDLSLSDCQDANGYWVGVGFTCATGGCDSPINDFCDPISVITNGVWDITNVGALTGDEQYDSEQCEEEYLGGMNADVWFSFTACSDEDLIVSTCGLINFDSDIVIYEGTCQEMRQVECNGDAGCAGFTSEVTLTGVIPNQQYLIRVGGFSPDSMGHGQIYIGGQNCQPDVPCLGDANGDGQVNTDDLLGVIDCWAGAAGCLIYDIDGDGAVGILDLLIVIQNWGMCDN